MGFRRQYHLDWREARRTMWHVDLGMLTEGLDDWSRTDENIARLVDRDDYYLNASYNQWITDPNDPELKRRQADRKRAGIKPPPHPVLMPVAARPPELHLRLAATALEQAQGTQPASAPGTADKTNDKKISIRELQRLRSGRTQ